MDIGREGNMAYIPPKILRELVLKNSKEGLTPEEERKFEALCNSGKRIRSNTDDFNPFLGMLFAGWCGGMFD